jgi:hypothetical protein
VGRYCIVDIRAWEGAGELEVGDHIWSISGEWSRVEAVSVSHDPQLMYNLTVDDAHTFFVGEQAWLVHNTICGNFGAINSNGQRTGIDVVITPPYSDPGPRPIITANDPPGYNRPDSRHDRGHLLAHILGGSSNVDANFVTMFEGPNRGRMRSIEIQVRNSVISGNTVAYSVTPVYGQNSEIPDFIHITAYSSDGSLSIDEIIPNQ